MDFAQENDLAKEKFTEGLLDLLVPVAEEIDQSVIGVRESQIELFREIERLSAELQKFVGIAKSPTLDIYVQKLVETRRKLILINTTLKTIQDRLDKTYSQASKRRASLVTEQTPASA